MIPNLHRTLNPLLRGGACEPVGPGVSVETINAVVRCLHAPVARSKFNLADQAVPDVMFERLSPRASRIGCVTQVGEYAALPSMRRHVVPGSTDVTVTVLEHHEPTEAWRTTFLTSDDIPRLPEIRIETPVTAFYEDITFPEGGEAAR